MRVFNAYLCAGALFVGLCAGAAPDNVESVDSRSALATDASKDGKGEAPSPIPDAECEQLRSRLSDLRNSLAAASLALRELSPTNRLGRLRDIERKAFEYDALSLKLRMKDREIARLRDELTEARGVIAKQAAHLTTLTNTTNELSKYVTRLENEQAPLKEALKLIRLGRYEYYEVRKGDTCESIAAQPTIYGDAKKHVWIRQANRDSVADLDRLVPGEMLVIPRFSSGGRYEL